MPIITLTTDFGYKDPSVGSVKGAIFSELPEANIIDISHEISPFNITETSYVLKNAYKSFPEGSVHIIGVDSELHQENKHIALKLDNHYFVCPDNGIISLIASEYNPEHIVEINIHDKVVASLTVLDSFIRVACHLARGGKLEIIGKTIKSFKKMKELQPIISRKKDQITGCVIYIDRYGNVVSNISRQLFQDIGKGRDFEINVNRYKFDTIRQKYSDIIDFNLPVEKRQKDGSKLALFNSADFLEIAIYKSNLDTVGGASSLLGLNYRDRIEVKFL